MPSYFNVINGAIFEPEAKILDIYRKTIAEFMEFQVIPQMHYDQTSKKSRLRWVTSVHFISPDNVSIHQHCWCGQCSTYGLNLAAEKTYWTPEICLWVACPSRSLHWDMPQCSGGTRLSGLPSSFPRDRDTSWAGQRTQAWSEQSWVFCMEILCFCGAGSEEWDFISSLPLRRHLKCQWISVSPEYPWTSERR